jgi:hypothetical protein
VRIGEENLEFEGENNRIAVLKINNLPEIDRLQIMGPGDYKMHLRFDTTYTMLPGKPTKIVPRPDPVWDPSQGDPKDVFNWAGEIGEATASGTFSAHYDPETGSTFSVTGWMDSDHAIEYAPGQKGHMGHERNGIFLRSEGEERREGRERR